VIKIINRAINAITKSIARQLYTRVVNLFSLLHWWSEFVWSKGNRNGAVQKFTWAERWEEVEKIERSRAERGAGGRGAGAERWAKITEMGTRSGKTARSAPLQCSAQEKSSQWWDNSVLYIRFNHLFAQSAIRQYNNQTVYLICWNATVLAFRLWPTTFTGAPFRLQNISGTTTALDLAPLKPWVQFRHCAVTLSNVCQML